MNLDFITKSEHQFIASDISELAKSVTLNWFEPGIRIVKQDEDAESFMMILQGSVLASYKLAEKDKAALFLGKKTTEADGFVKSLQTLTNYKT